MTTGKRTVETAQLPRKRQRAGEDNEQSDGSIESSESEEEEEEEEEDDEEDDEEEEDDDEDASEEDSRAPLADRMATEQRILTEERELAARLKADRATVAREGGLETATAHLKSVNDVFNEKEKLKIENKTLELYDSRNFVESSDLMDIAVRNIKVGSTDKILKTEDYIKRMRLFLLRTSMRHDVDAGDDPQAYLAQRHKFEEFNWFSFGTFAYCRGTRAHTTDHLLGPLALEKKKREMKPHVRLTNTAQVTTAQAVTSDDLNNKVTDYTTVAVLHAYKTFQQKVGNNRAMNIFKFFINPSSFGQSVENMFYTSFLLKDGRLQLGEDKDGYPTISLPPPLPEDRALAQQEASRRADLSSNHLIFQLEKESWLKLIEKFNITESFIPTRDENGV